MPLPLFPFKSTLSNGRVVGKEEQLTPVLGCYSGQFLIFVSFLPIFLKKVYDS
jgi:hypothetical protein